MLKLDLSNEAMRFIETLAGKQYKQVVGAMIGLLKEPAPHDSRALVGYPYRLSMSENNVLSMTCRAIGCGTKPHRSLGDGSVDRAWPETPESTI